MTNLLNRRSIPRVPHICAAILCLGLSASASARTTVEAYVGEPFGVGRVTVDVVSSGPLMPKTDDRVTVVDADRRVLYPATKRAPFRRIVRQLLEIDAPSQVTIYFLFRGDGPLKLTAYGPTAVPIDVRPTLHARKYSRTLNAWWSEYTGSNTLLARGGEYPQVVQNYLTTTLARRLQLRLPDARRGIFRNNGENEAIGLLLGAESIRAAIQKDLLLDNRPSGPETADQPLPEPLITPSVEYPVAPPETPIETIAMHVPHECFYVRFGNFSNYLWLRDFMDQWGGDMANIITVRGIDYHTNERIEQQLGLKQGALAKILGPAVISDIAIVGSDSFLREGAAIGVLFEARNNLLLGQDIQRQRNEAKAKHADGSEEEIKFDEHKVSYISTPDGSMRSYYATDGDYHFVTTSRALVGRFFEAGAGTGSLGQSAEFRHARVARPLERDDTIFAYLSDAFIRRMVSPHYRVEMTRRMRSLAEIDAIRIARLAAAAEGVAAHSVPELVGANLLPPRFGQRPDGSQLFETENGFVDSMRGSPGGFIPIPDVPVAHVTASEAAAYERFGKTYRGEWKKIDPVIAAIRRTPLGPPGLERMTIELIVTPYHKPTYEPYARWLGPPTHLAKAPIVGDVGSLEVVLGGHLVATFAGGPPQPTHLFGGLRDFRSPYVVERGRVTTPDAPPSLVRGYLGIYPLPRGLDAILGGPRPEAFDDDGYAPPPADSGWFKDCWQRRFDGWGILSFKRDVLAEVTPQMAMIEHPRAAQVRLRIEDLSDKAMSSTVSAFGYQRARDASASGSRFMNSLSRQLHVPPAACKDAAEQLIGGTFHCPLGGEYAIVESPNTRPLWVSNALRPDNRFLMVEIPADYTFPVLTWFRGLSAELSLTDDTLSAHIELDVQNKVNGLAVPGLNLPGFSFGEKVETKTKKPEPEELPPPKSP